MAVTSREDGTAWDEAKTVEDTDEDAIEVKDSAAEVSGRLVESAGWLITEGDPEEAGLVKGTVLCVPNTARKQARTTIGATNIFRVPSGIEHENECHF